MGAYESLMAKQKDIETIGQISGLLGWDQEVMMPPKAAPLRALHCNLRYAQFQYFLDLWLLHHPALQ